jgi:hypothetical protein
MPADPLDTAMKAVEIFCETKSPEEFAAELRVSCSRRGSAITIAEERAPWHPERQGDAWTSSKVAQLRYDAKSATWSLYCRDSGERWWAYDEVAPSPSVDPLLAEIDRDPTGIFWG